MFAASAYFTFFCLHATVLDLLAPKLECNIPIWLYMSRFLECPLSCLIDSGSVNLAGFASQKPQFLLFSLRASSYSVHSALTWSFGFLQDVSPPQSALVHQLIYQPLGALGEHQAMGCASKGQ